MPRTRQIYQGDALAVGPTGAFPATGQHYQGGNAVFGTSAGNQASGTTNLVAELFRVQSANYSYSHTLTDVNQFGELAAIDRIPLRQPAVPLTINWLTANLVNEKLIGFDVVKGAAAPVSCISGILNGTTDSKNYFVKSVTEGNDVVNFIPGTVGNVFALGNGFITNYTAQGSVGNFPTVSVSIEGLNAEFENSTSGQSIPAVNPSDGTAITGWKYQLPTGFTQNFGEVPVNSSNTSLSVLRPGDITLSMGIAQGDSLFDESDLKVQSYTLTIPIGREDLLKLGSKYAHSKVINFPVTCTLSVVAQAGDFFTGSLIEIVNNNKTFNPTVTITKPSDSTTMIAAYQLRGAKMDSQEITSSIGQNKSVTFNFSTQIGGPQSTSVGVFMSGQTA